ncbi:MAG: amidohydrolase family protein [Gammaproteobacteria bacterium]|nr:amidohydrolase family protein [Gammaproteobacteria bacterium]
MTVIDCDSHIMEPADLWERYLEPRFRDRAIRIEEEDGIEKLVIGEQVVLEGVVAALGGAHLDPVDLFTPGQIRYADGCEPASYDPHARARLLDDWGVDRGVLFPTIGILPFPTDDADLANAYCRAYNTWQAEFFQTVPDRVVPIAVVNWHDVEEAARELDRCLRLGFRGLFVPPEVVDGKRPGDPHFDPIWSRLQDADFPGCLHVIVRFEGAAAGFSAWNQSGAGLAFGFGLGATGQLIPAMATLVLDGVFDRFPRLKMVSVEAGCGYAAYLMDRLDEKHHFFQAMAPLELKPSDYFRRNCYFVAEPEERSIGAMLELVGKDNILWGSDYPHIDSRLDAAELIRASVAGLDEVSRKRVMGENGLRVFGLEP